jgi:phosphoglucosamine mutase
MKRTGRSLAELAAGMPQFPQVMVNVKVRERIDPRQSPAIQEPCGASSRRSAATGGWCCAHPAPNR